MSIVKVLSSVPGSVSAVSAQSISNAGTEFWAVVPTHEPGGNLLADLSVFITGSQASAGRITVCNYTSAFTVNANQVTEVQIPRSAAYIHPYPGGFR